MMTSPRTLNDLVVMDVEGPFVKANSQPGSWTPHGFTAHGSSADSTAFEIKPSSNIYAGAQFRSVLLDWGLTVTIEELYTWAIALILRYINKSYLFLLPPRRPMPREEKRATELRSGYHPYSTRCNLPSATSSLLDQASSSFLPRNQTTMAQEHPSGSSRALSTTSNPHNPIRMSFSHNNQPHTDLGSQLHGPSRLTQNINNPARSSSEHDSHTTVHQGHYTKIIGDYNHSTINNLSNCSGRKLQMSGRRIAQKFDIPHPNAMQKRAKRFDSSWQPRWTATLGPGSTGFPDLLVLESRPWLKQLLKTEQSKKLVAGFFSRSHPKRNVPTYLFLTIAYGLATSIPELRGLIGRVIRSNPLLLHSSLEHQFTELIAKPCRSLGGQGLEWGDRPRLVVIDGLDECNGGSMQMRILDIIANALRGEPGLPLQFLVCSRPEPVIKEFFNLEKFHSPLWCYSLHNDDSAWHDIVTYLCDGFQTIRSKLRYHQIQFPEPWPSHDDIEKLA
ncbi:hypothetical protein E1B28_009607 [Marasmius oreades]|uniref:Nephrocystin 3-like N-terminal domain-containing protein n=1 Tax=Marasmius oreades TaxID=181124 RepID=A0A9P7RVF9_9AGAR|nr:uncharacterized protein E1B28_009607 [Marasmius oreades]KAG7090494.1 hypothetical protein E1B28_009607 [Marasmius oreades]